jgi:D-alanyl-D-alanine-carboxypeptidase/D-alanyl-D-alanine-endopeptidase
MPDVEIGMAWHIYTKFGADIYWHNGGTAGYRSFVGFDPAKNEGVVVLCNTFVDNDDLGRHISTAAIRLRLSTKRSKLSRRFWSAMWVNTS